MSDDGKVMRMGLHVTQRPYGSNDTELKVLRLGGQRTLVLVELEFKDDPDGVPRVNVHVDATGCPDDEALIELFHGIAEHMETQPSVHYTEDGVEAKEPLRKADNG